MLIAYFDGLCEDKNPGGYACGGYVIMPHEATNGIMLFGDWFYLHGPGSTNNYAEYMAAISALKAIWNLGYRGKVTLKGDSQLVARQFSGEYTIRSENLKPLLERLKRAATYFESLDIVWVPREENTLADEQSRLAYQRVTGKICPVRGRR